MRDYKFDIASDFFRYVDKYDIRGSGAGMNYEAKTVTVYDYGKSMMGAESVVVVPSVMSDDEPNGLLKDGTNVQRINPELGLRGSMAVLWVRNEQSEFLLDGEFCRFNDFIWNFTEASAQDKHIEYTKTVRNKQREDVVL